MGHNSASRGPIAEWIGTASKAAIGASIVQEANHFVPNSVLARTHKHASPCLDAFGPLCLIPHNQNRATERWHLLLYSSRVS